MPTQAEITRARVFQEPLLPVHGIPTAEQNLALSRVLTTYLNGGGGENTAPIEAILEAHSLGPWQASLLLNVGIVYLRTGRPSRALRAFAEAWALASTATDAFSKAVADMAVGQWAQVLARVGQVTELHKVLAEVEGRTIGGTAGELLQEGREGAHLMATQPDRAFRCGPLALDRYLRHGRPEYRTDPKLSAYQPSHWGTNLTEMQQLAQDLGAGLQMAKRVDLAAPILVPAVVHWNLGHFAALVEERDGKLLLEDPVFGGELWMSRKAFDDEMSGYALVSTSSLPKGWRSVAADEGNQIWGRGQTTGGNSENQSHNDCKQPCPENTCCCGGGSGSPGMASYGVHSMLVSLNLVDTPVGYAPPRGPSARFTVTYNQRDSFQPQVFPYWNLGSRWTNDWMAYVTDDPTNGAQPATVYLRGGGQETHTGFNSSTNSYAIHYRWRAKLVRTSSSPIVYQRQLPDGSIEEFGQPDGALTFPRKVLLTRLIDPQGNTLSLTYDSSLRVVAATDALGQVTTVSYELPSDALKVTKVSDPFGRFATFEYDTSGRLIRITDVIGIQSQFDYDAASFISALTTPYGRTGFLLWSEGTDRWIEITDPLGGKERVEYRNYMTEVPGSDSVVPLGFSNNANLQYRNTFYWNKRAYSQGAVDYTKATIYHWLHTADGVQTGGTLESKKMPLENRVWYAYPGQGSPYFEGAGTQPTTIAHVLDDVSNQSYQYEYNALGKVTKSIDPLGRETDYVYGVNNVPDANPTTGEGIDLLQVKRKNGANYDVLRTYTYNNQHQPLTITDARGATTTYTYNAAGQVLTVTTPPAQGQSQGPVTTYTYDTNGYLQSVAGPIPGATTSFTYDGYGRRRTTTDPTGLTLTYDYDALDRGTQVSYPDGTSEQTTYNRLDAEWKRDRLGRSTHILRDALRRVVATRDPAGGTTQYRYGGAGCSSCAGGGDQLTALIDPNGNQTSWTYDLQGRVTQETRADQSSESYVYEATSSRLHQRTDRKGVATTLTYFPDNKLAGKSYSDTTPAVSYTYDPLTGLMLTAANGTDTLTWTYDNLDRVASEASSKNASMVGYSYDDAGNRTALTLNGSGYLTYGYDQQSRLTGITYGAQHFGFGYDTASRRTSMTYPNGILTSYGYDTESRLTSLGASLGSTPITSFNYVLDAVGNRTSKTTLDWTESYGYDAANRLLSADRSSGTPSRWRFAYDLAGNRTSDQTDDAVMAGGVNNLNQLLSRQAGGALTFSGTTNKPATVTVSGKNVPTSPAPANAFSAQAPIGSGTSNVVVSATDANGNTRTNTYQVSASGAGGSYTYDPNGNLISKTEGANAWTYTWDADNRLTQVLNNGTTVATFAYDPVGRRVQKTAAGVTTAWTYAGAGILRQMVGATTLTYVHGPRIDEPLASDDGTTLSFFHADGLGSIVKTTNPGGAVTSARQYDAWGNPQAGSTTAGYAFTGREWDPETGLYYYRARYYDSATGRFISADPAGLRSAYGYVGGSPVSYTDPTGMVSYSVTRQYYNDGLAYYDPTGVQVFPDCTESKSCKGKWDLAFDVKGVIGIHFKSDCTRAHEEAHADVFESTMKSRLYILEKAEGARYNSKPECQNAAKKAIDEFWNGGLWAAFRQLVAEVLHPCF